MEMLSVGQENALASLRWFHYYCRSQNDFAIAQLGSFFSFVVGSDLGKKPWLEGATETKTNGTVAHKKLFSSEDVDLTLLR
mmetsp:Transcript_11432/g.31579  ORF Transcript_11432/g.31579 Transcript_11432/m.31579 type:complete len:81 (+) Transcript_11432:891-1133(+)